MGEPIGMSCVGSICGPFHCCSTSETWRLAWSLPISVMAALIAAVRWVTDGGRCVRFMGMRQILGVLG